MTKTVAQAMLAKVYAEKEVQDYDKVIAYADKVMNTTGVELEDSYETLWGYDETAKTAWNAIPKKVFWRCIGQPVAETGKPGCTAVS